MKTLTVDEAMTGLSKWLELALSGEQIQIRKGDALVELRPARPPRSTPRKESLAPREALRLLQQDAHLTQSEAESYLLETRDERSAIHHREVAAVDSPPHRIADRVSWYFFSFRFP
jgi:antitoxin (DNA-binding transcriptional repressor) of toxin-antitoxin stability system